MIANNAITLTVAIALCCIFSTIMFGCQQTEATKRAAIEAGLVQKLGPGSMTPLWTLPVTK